MNFKKRVNGSWADTPHYIHNTSTDTITALPAVVYPNATTATVGLKGNAVQSSTPSPTSPVMPQGCGDLEATGEHAGQYKIPISSASTTTPIYLGEVETTRRIKKLVLTGEENWENNSNNACCVLYINPIGTFQEYNPLIRCSHVPMAATQGNLYNRQVDYGITFGGKLADRICIRNKDCEPVTDFKAWLASEYANGTPVTIWYVLAEPETAIVNEPIRKIGDYADEVSGITIPVTAGANALSVDTTVQPSEVTVNYKGWHTVQSVHERENGAWT